MDTPCNCGQIKSLGFRTVIHSNKVKIKRVPVWECEECGLYEVFSGLKQDLRELLVHLQNDSDSLNDSGSSVQLGEYNEFADVMYEVYKEIRFRETEAVNFLSEVEARCKERINLLLDVYGYAKQSEDEQWMNQLMTRLSQLTFTPAETT